MALHDILSTYHQVGSDALEDVRFGIRVYLTNMRVIFVDVEPVRTSPRCLSAIAITKGGAHLDARRRARRSRRRAR
jgi:hypothetical protein